MSDPRIVVVGDALIDELVSAESTEEHVGGAALNVAVGLRILGLDVDLVAMVGTDGPGETIRRHLAHWGVRLHPTFTDVSSRAISDRSAGEPRYRFNTAAQQRRIAFDPAQRAALDRADLILVSCFPFDDQPQVDLLLESVGKGDRVILDPNPRSGMMHDPELFLENFEALASRSLLTKIGDEDADLLYGLPLRDVIGRLHERGASAILATAGAGGASLIAPGVRVDVGIAELPQPIVDTMGAGDATLAAVAETIAREGMPTDPAEAERMLESAMRVAAATCRHPGALLRIPVESNPH
ncbi:PfkB family carbohydrate kinase [Diaminobutyricibacter sp. McL0608]|uniref:PfkB family carbohydrate kinase n=1 Tax=Leifsonia sp. McL0608 TaxID=3143537 RepID=UPI0031F313BC